MPARSSRSAQKGIRGLLQKIISLSLADRSFEPLEDLKHAAATQYVVKNGVVYTIPQIVAPFKTPVQTAARRKALLAFARACKLDRSQCYPQAAAGH